MVRKPLIILRLIKNLDEQEQGAFNQKGLSTCCGHPVNVKVYETVVW
jgi:hypothetical protein